ncbi:MAG: hypothetical protein VW420_00450, partial [Schleiferiaceae bacterium]
MTGLMMVLVLFLAVFAAAQIMRIYELSVKVRQEEEYEITDKDNSNQGRLMLLFGIGMPSFET